MEADGPAITKTRECMEGAATAVQAMHGDSFSACRVDPGLKTNSTSFGMMAEHPALSCRDDVLVERSDAAPTSCLPSLEMRSPIAAGGLVPTGKTSTATKIPFIEPPLRLYSVEDTIFKKSPTLYASYDSSVLQESDLPAAPYCRRVVEIKSRQNRTLDPGGSQGHLRACPFLGSWRALACSEVMRAGAAGDELQRFFGGDSLAL